MLAPVEGALHAPARLRRDRGGIHAGGSRPHRARRLPLPACGGTRVRAPLAASGAGGSRLSLSLLSSGLTLLLPHGADRVGFPLCCCDGGVEGGREGEGEVVADHDELVDDLVSMAGSGTQLASMPRMERGVRSVSRSLKYWDLL